MYCMKRVLNLCFASEHMNSSVVVWFLFVEVFFSFGCLEWAALFYFGTPWAFHIIILYKQPVVGLAKTYIGLDQSCVPLLIEKTKYLLYSKNNRG